MTLGELKKLHELKVYYTVEPLIKDTLNNGPILSIKDTLLGPFSLLLHFNLKDLSIKDKMAGPKCIHYSEFHCTSL